MSHYFINDENMESNVVTINYVFNDIEMTFKTDNGLFSKEHVDYASNILMHEIPELNGKVLDLGCGYGPIGITMSKAYDVDVTMVDVNPKAVNFSKINCEINGVNGEVIESDGFANVSGVFDAIILNPPIHAGKKVIYQMYEDAYDHLVDGGRFYIVIQKKHGAKTTMEKLDQVFTRVVTLYKTKGFFVLECVR